MEKISEYNEAMFYEVINNHLTLKELKYAFYHNPKINPEKKNNRIGELRKPHKLVQPHCNIDVLIIINEEIFNELKSESIQKLAIEKLLTDIHKDRQGNLAFSNPDIQEYSLLIKKYGYEKAVEEYNLVMQGAIERFQEMQETN